MIGLEVIDKEFGIGDVVISGDLFELYGVVRLM